MAIDPAAGKIYWTNQSPAGTPPGSVRRANLDGTNPETVVDNQANPIGVAVASGKIYWTNLASGEVRAANLADPVGTATTLFTNASFGPSGPSIDPTANKIYWASWQSQLGIRVGNLDGTGFPSTLISGPDSNGEFNSLFTAVLKAPVNTVRPNISGGAKVGKELTCQTGTWAPDLLGAFLYRAPASFGDYQWQRNGAGIASGPTFTPGPGVRRLHLHRDGHQPGRVDPLADERCEEGQGEVGQGQEDRQRSAQAGAGSGKPIDPNEPGCIVISPE